MKDKPIRSTASKVLTDNRDDPSGLIKVILYKAGGIVKPLFCDDNG
jgi:hypothetical protein